MFIGGVKPGKRGRGAEGKTLVAIAVETLSSKGFGRIRMAVIPDAAAATLRRFLLDHVEEGSTVITDGLPSYPKATQGNYRHDRFVVSQTEAQAHIPLPGVHRVASLVKRWLLGTHHGSVSADHLQAYLDEFTFRFNRRHSRSRGLLFRRLLEQAVDAPPATYQNLVATRRTITPAQRRQLEPPPPDKRVAPDSLAIDIPPRPTRRDNQR